MKEAFQRRKCRAPLICTISLALSALCSTASANPKILSPEISSEPLFNPGKGWVCYTPPGQATQDEIALASVGYERFEWGSIQPVSQEVYNWKALDQFIEAWAAKGKQVAFGVMCSNSHSGLPDGYVVPKWAYDAGVEQKSMVIKEGDDVMTGTPGIKRDPADFTDPKFMELHETFVKNYAARYDGDPRIAFIDIRSFKNWGEGYHDLHVQMYLRHFKKTRLCQSIEDVRWSENVAKKGVAIRRDGIGGSKGQECAPAFDLAPAVFEFWGGLNYLKERNWWNDGRLISDSLEIGKPTYVELVRNSPRFIPEYRDLINRLTNKIGFHFVLTKAQIPTFIAKGVPQKAEFSWANHGVAPIYVPCVPAVALIDEKNVIVDTSILEGSNPRKWMPDENVSEEVSFLFPKAPPGTYRLAVGLMRTAEDSVPAYLIGIKTPIHHRWHVLGNVTLE